LEEIDQSTSVTVVASFLSRWGRFQGERERHAADSHAASNPNPTIEQHDAHTRHRCRVWGRGSDMVYRMALPCYKTPMVSGGRGPIAESHPPACCRWVDWVSVWTRHALDHPSHVRAHSNMHCNIVMQSCAGCSVCARPLQAYHRTPPARVRVRLTLRWLQRQVLARGVIDGFKGSLWRVPSTQA
jgi:hypothetical protein